MQKNPLTTDLDIKLHSFQGRAGIFHKKCVLITFMIVGMTNEKMRERKARSAQLAGVRLLARVNTLVIPQLVRLGKRFQADGTAVGPLVPPVDLLAVLGIRDIFVRIRIRIRIRLLFFTDFNDAKKYFFSLFFLLTCQQAFGTSSSV